MKNAIAFKAGLTFALLLNFCNNSNAGNSVLSTGIWYKLSSFMKPEYTSLPTMIWHRLESLYRQLD